MSVTLKDVIPKIGPNPGGMVNLYIAKNEDVQIPAPTVDATSGAEVYSADLIVTGDGFAHFQFDPGTCKLSHPTVGEDGSKSQETLIDFAVAGDDDRLDMFEKMLNGRYIALTDAASGVMRLVGATRTPLLLINASYDGGAEQPEKNGTIFQLKGRGGKNSKRYTGAIPVVAAVV